MDKNYKINLIFIISFYTLLVPFFEAIFNPLMKNHIIYNLSLKLIVIEMLKFTFINLIIYKMKNEGIKKFIIFLSMFVYSLGYNMLMFCLTNLFQKNLKIGYKEILYTYMSILLGMFIHKYRVIENVFSFVFNENSKISIIIFVFSIIITSFIYYEYKKNNSILELSMNIINVSLIGIMVYNTLFNNALNLILENIDINIIYNQMLIVSVITLIMMFIFYYFDISIKDKNVSLLIYISFTYFILYAFIRSVISYKIMGMIILIYTVFLILDKKFEMVDKIKIEIEKYKKKFK